MRTQVGAYRAKSGKTGARIWKHAASDGRTSYAYDGEWGAGGGFDAEQIRDLIAGWLTTKRGVRVEVPFKP